jgi:hypothetical protein
VPFAPLSLFTQQLQDFASKAALKAMIIRNIKLKRLKTDKVPEITHLCKNECV